MTNQTHYIYGMSRPPMYATCPDGFDGDWMPDSSMTEYSYFAAYFRPLTLAEQIRYEMRPYSPNTYNFQIGDWVINENNRRCKIVKQTRNWMYEVEVHVPNRGVFEMHYHQAELKAETESDG